MAPKERAASESSSTAPPPPPALEPAPAPAPVFLTSLTGPPFFVLPTAGEGAPFVAARISAAEGGLFGLVDAEVALIREETETALLLAAPEVEVRPPPPETEGRLEGDEGEGRAVVAMRAVSIAFFLDSSRLEMNLSRMVAVPA